MESDESERKKRERSRSRSEDKMSISEKSVGSKILIGNDNWLYIRVFELSFRPFLA